MGKALVIQNLPTYHASIKHEPTGLNEMTATLQKHDNQLQHHNNQLLQASRRGVRAMIVLTGEKILPGDSPKAVVTKNVKDLCGGYNLQDTNFQTLPCKLGVGPTLTLTFTSCPLWTSTP